MKETKKVSEWVRCPMTGVLCAHCEKGNERCVETESMHIFKDRIMTFVIGLVLALIVLFLVSGCASRKYCPTYANVIYTTSKS